jgi:hypothetical protein
MFDTNVLLAATDEARAEHEGGDRARLVTAWHQAVEEVRNDQNSQL